MGDTSTPDARPGRRVVEGISHGMSGYSHSGCRCEVCTAANRDYSHGYRRRPLSEKSFEHGRSAYANHGCRCEVCKAAQREYGKSYRARPLEEKTFSHGRGGYTNHGCRCEVCARANQEHSRSYYYARKNGIVSADSSQARVR